MPDSLISEEPLTETAHKNTGPQLWKLSDFRQKFYISLAVLLLIFVAMPHYFQFIQQRRGAKLQDPILDLLPAFDTSWMMFFLMYTLGLYAARRTWQNPAIFLNYVVAYILITLTRSLTIYFLPLEPPVGLINLVDPFTSFFYGGKIITRDLFFSGHTSSIFLIYFVLEGKNEKRYALAVTLAVASMLLFQHIHYTLDVLVAFPATYALHYLAKKWTKY
jgi:PAP2 superfamily C-terminal